METSTLTDKGQTTTPQEIREAMGALPCQRLVWEASKYGSVVVHTTLAGSQRNLTAWKAKDWGTAGKGIP